MLNNDFSSIALLTYSELKLNFQETVDQLLKKHDVKNIAELSSDRKDQIALISNLIKWLDHSDKNLDQKAEILSGSMIYVKWKIDLSYGMFSRLVTDPKNSLLYRSIDPMLGVTKEKFFSKSDRDYLLMQFRNEVAESHLGYQKEFSKNNKGISPLFGYEYELMQIVNEKRLDNIKEDINQLSNINLKLANGKEAISIIPDQKGLYYLLSNMKEYGFIKKDALEIDTNIKDEWKKVTSKILDEIAKQGHILHSILPVSHELTSKIICSDIATKLNGRIIKDYPKKEKIKPHAKYWKDEIHMGKKLNSVKTDIKLAPLVMKDFIDQVKLENNKFEGSKIEEKGKELEFIDKQRGHTFTKKRYNRLKGLEEKIIEIKKILIQGNLPENEINSLKLQLEKKEKIIQKMQQNQLSGYALANVLVPYDYKKLMVEELQKPWQKNVEELENGGEKVHWSKHPTFFNKQQNNVLKKDEKNITNEHCSIEDDKSASTIKPN